MEGRLKLGTAKVDITPASPVPLAGFAQRSGSFRGIWHRLFAKIFFFESEFNREVKKAVVISADLIWWDTTRAKDLRQRIAKQWGVDESSIILHATHTHLGPQTSNRFVPSLGLMDLATVETIENTVLRGIGVAERDLEPVIVYRGFGECRIGVNRRRVVNKHVIMAPNPDGPIDPEVIVICFKRKDGSTKAIWMHYTCHPTCSAENYVSSEYPGVAEGILERRLDDRVIAAFFQGCCGDVRPGLVLGGAFVRGGKREIEVLGTILAKEVMKVLAQPMRMLRPVPLWSKQVTAELPTQVMPSRIYLQEKSDEPGVIGEWSRLLLAEPERIRASVPLELAYVQIAAGLGLLAMSAEVVVEYGLMIKKVSGGNVVPLPYSNGMIGYIPTARQIEEGGYESHDAAYYFGLPSPFAKMVEKRMTEAIRGLVREGGRS